MSTIIRRAASSDLGPLVELFDGYRQFYGRPSEPDAGREFLRARLESEDSALFIACDDETSVGFCQLYPSFSSVALARTYILNDLFVKASARRNGVAKMLLLAAAEFAKSSGAVRLTLSTGRDNAVAQALYDSAGWQRDEQFFVYHRSIASGRAENKNFPQPD